MTPAVEPASASPRALCTDHAISGSGHRSLSDSLRDMGEPRRQGSSSLPGRRAVYRQLVAASAHCGQGATCRPNQLGTPAGGPSRENHAEVLTQPQVLPLRGLRRGDRRRGRPHYPPSAVPHLGGTDWHSEKRTILCPKTSSKPPEDTLRREQIGDPASLPAGNPPTNGAHRSPRAATLQRVRETARQPQRVASHPLHHSIAAHYLEKGFDVEYVTDLLRHTSIRSTAICARITMKDRHDMIRGLDRSGYVVFWS